MTTEQLNCPKCGQVDMVQKISAIYSGGITTSALSGPSIGGAVPIGEGQVSVGGGYTTLKGGSQSLLSSRLAPPPQPAAEGRNWAFIVPSAAMLCFGVFLFLCGISSIPDSIGEKVVFIIFALGLIGIGGAILRASDNNANKRKQKVVKLISQWEKAVARWDKLYFCARDDGVFDPNERVFISTNQMNDYISR